MYLRPFKSSDLEKLYEIDQSCFPPGISYSLRELEEFIQHGDSATWIAEEEKEIVGFLIASRHPEMPTGHIITIDVVADSRRRGIGSLLMNAVEDWARERGLISLSLETAETNLAAQAFYERRGYLKYDKLDDYYADGSAAWVMVKWLVRPQAWKKRGTVPKH